MLLVVVISSSMVLALNSYKKNEVVLRAAHKAGNVTYLLDSVLKNYDKTFRPGFNAEKTPVLIDMLVRTMGPVSELTETWNDPRLRFNGSSGQPLSLSMTMLDKIWKPDTYFWNGARSYIHTMTNSNRLVRLYPDGTVLFSSRLTVQGRCSMEMRRYPLDRQACRLLIGSYAYTDKELSYSWKIVGNDTGVQLDHKGISDLPQFSLIGYQIFEASTILRDQNYSVLEVRFYFDRHVGYFLMNFYVPCTLIVLLCWVAFWTNREATGDRIGMGITSVLTMVLIANDSKKDAPRVDFPTALDVYIWICYSTLLVCMIEFTVVHYHTKFNTGDPEIQAVEREKLRQIIRRIPKKAVMSSRHYRNRTGLRQPMEHPFNRRDGGRHSMIHRTKKLSVLSESPQQKLLSHQHSVESREDFERDNVGWRLYYWMMDHGERKTDPFGLAQNSISLVDRFARIALPISFIFIVFMYYHLYVNTPFNFMFDNTSTVHYA